MASYLMKRMGLMVITFIVTVFLFFMFIKLMPNSQPTLSDPIQQERYAEKEGWNEPIPVQFGIWVNNIFTEGSFGFSANKRQDVGSYYFSKMPASIQINIIPYLLSIPIAISLGILAALYKNKWIDNLISVGIMVFISIPYFVVIVIIQFVFYFELSWLPSHVVATSTDFASNYWWALSTYFMPVAVLTLVSVPGLARSVRAELTEQLTQDYMLLARSKGLTKRQATFRHALKNALVPFLPGIFIGIIGIINGGLITEKLFRVDGTGRIYLDAFQSIPPDYAMLMLITTFGQFIALLSAIVGDLSYTLIDPRVRVGSGKLS